MKRVVLADTGPLYAAVDPDDQYHGRAQRELKRLSRDKACRSCRLPHTIGILHARALPFG
jgi:hypothetical protein